MLARRAEIAREKKAETSMRLLQAAFEVLGHEEGRDMQIDDLLSHVGMARGTFYNYFESREHLFNVLSFECNHGLDEALAKDVEPPLWACQAIRIYLHRAAEDPAWGWAMVNMSLNGPRILGEDTWRHAENTLRAGMESGDFKIASLRVGMDLVMGTALSAILSILRGETDPDHPERIACGLLLSLGVPPARAERLSRMPLPPIPMGNPRFGRSPVSAILPSRRPRRS